MPEIVTLKGKSFELTGKLIQEGEKAPDCELVGADLQVVTLSSFKGKYLVLMSVPSLDTAVCSKETHKFNQELEKFKDFLHIVCISMDLPFAQARWCAAEGVKNVTTLSDYRKREFGEKYGLFIPELGLLARAVMLLDSNRIVKKMQLVKEISNEPDYPSIFEEIHHMISAAGKFHK